MPEIDVYSATKVEKCETRHRSITDQKLGQTKALKEIVPQEIKDVLKSPIITNLELVLQADKFGLPAGSRLTILPSIGSFRIARHMTEGNISEFQNYLLS
jgi:hypothetical protein